MKATLEFDLSPGSDDHHEHALAIHAHDLYSSLADIRAFVRDKLKYGEPTKAEKEALEHVRDLLPTEVLAILE